MSLTLVDTAYDGANRVFTLQDGARRYKVYEPMSGWAGYPQPYTVTEPTGNSYTTYNLPEPFIRALRLGA
jgi:hypothetical protein